MGVFEGGCVDLTEVKKADWPPMATELARESEIE